MSLTAQTIIKKALLINLLVLVFPLTIFADTVDNEAGKAIDSEAWQQRFQRSEWVSLVRVESVQSLINPSLTSQSGMTAVQGYSYSLSVVQDWKAAKSDVVKLRVDLSDCPLLLALDNEYLVFASENYRGGLQIKQCDDLLHRNDAIPVMSLLESLKETQKSASINH